MNDSLRKIYTIAICTILCKFMLAHCFTTSIYCQEITEGIKSINQESGTTDNSQEQSNSKDSSSTTGNSTADTLAQPGQIKPENLQNEKDRLGRLLRSFDMGDVADQLGARTQVIDDDFAFLTQELLRISDPDKKTYIAAEEVLNRWENTSTQDYRLVLYRAILHDLKGEPEIALRHLTDLRYQKDRFIQELAKTYERMIRMSMSGIVVSPTSNPWQIKFLVKRSDQLEDSEIVAEGKPFQVEWIEQINFLLQFRSSDGGLWALLGELLAVQKNYDLALKCFTRAKSLRFESIEMAEHQALVFDLLKLEKSQINDQLFHSNGLSNTSNNNKISESSTPQDQEQGKSVEDQLRTSTYMQTVVILGIGVIGLLIVWQVRLWFAGNKRN